MVNTIFQNMSGKNIEAHVDNILVINMKVKFHVFRLWEVVECICWHSISQPLQMHICGDMEKIV